MKPARKTQKGAATSGRSTNRAVMAMAVMGCFVLLYGWNSFFLAPKGRAKAAVQKDLAAAKHQEDDLRANLAELRKLANDTQAREAELARLGKLVPADPDVAGAILALNDTAHAAGVEWSSFLPAPPVPGPAGTTVGISMKVGGTFAQVFEYLRQLELLDRLVVVDSVNLAGGGGTGGAPKIDADIKARMFAAGTSSPAPAPAPAAKVAAGAQPASSPSGSAALPKAGG